MAYRGTGQSLRWRPRCARSGVDACLHALTGGGGFVAAVGEHRARDVHARFEPLAGDVDRWCGPLAVAVLAALGEDGMGGVALRGRRFGAAEAAVAASSSASFHVTATRSHGMRSPNSVTAPQNPSRPATSSTDQPAVVASSASRAGEQWQ